MKKTESPNCEVCGIVEDVHHLLVECIRYKQEREVLLSKLNVNHLELGAFLTVLLEPHSADAIEIYEFVGSLKRTQ